MGLEKGCPCYKFYEDDLEFKKVMQLKSAGLVIYRHTTPVNSDASVSQPEKAFNTKDNVFIIHNTKNRNVSTSNYMSEFEQAISCPRCRYIVKHTKELLLNVPFIRKKDVIGICDHCRFKKRINDRCNKCQLVVEAFLKKQEQKQEERSDSDKQEKVLTTKIKHILKDAPKAVYRKSKSQLRSETSLRNASFRYKTSPTSHVPHVKDMFEIKKKTEKNKQHLKKTFLRQIETPKLYKYKSDSEITLIDHANRYREHEKPNKNILFNSAENIAFPESSNESVELIGLENKHQHRLDRLRQKLKPKIELDLKRLPSTELEEYLQKDDSFRHTNYGSQKWPSVKSDMQEKEKIKKDKHSYYDIHEAKYEQEVSKSSQKEEIFLKGIQKPSRSAHNIRRENLPRSASATSEAKLQKDFSYFFIKDTDVVKKPPRKLISSSELIKDTQDMYRSRAEEERLKKEQELKEKLEAEEKKRLAKIERKRRLEEERPLEELKKKKAKEQLKNQGAEEELMKKRAEEELMKKRAEEELKRKRAEEKLMKKRVEEELKRKRVKEEQELNKKKKSEQDIESQKKSVKSSKEPSEKSKSSKLKDSEIDKSLKSERDLKLIKEQEKQDKEELMQLEKQRKLKPKAEKEQMRKAKEEKQKEKEEKQKEKEEKQKEKEEKQKEKEEKKKQAAQLRMEQEQKQREKEDRLKAKTERQKEKEEMRRPKPETENVSKDIQEDSKKEQLEQQLADQQKEKESKKRKKQEDEAKKLEAQLKLKSLREAKTEVEPEKPQSKKIPEETKIKELNINQVKVRKSSADDLILQLVKLKQKRKILKERIDKPNKTLRDHKRHKNIKTDSCIICLDSDLELDIENNRMIETKPEEINDIIIGQKIFKYTPPLVTKKEDKGIKPLFFESTHTESENNIAKTQEVKKNIEKPVKKKENIAKPVKENEKKPPVLSGKYVEQEVPKGIIHYALSDRTFIEKGWTMLPTEKVVRKMNVYRMRPAHPEFDWFEHNKSKKLICYDTGEKLAEFNDSGKGRWFYRNGKVALDYYDAEEINAQQRIVIFSSGEPDERGCSRPFAILASFDYLGNGIVFDHSGKIRLKYNQTEGVVLDRSIGPVSHWKWHTLNDPPVLQQVMIDTQMAHKDPEILKLSGSHDNKPRPDNEEMLAIEFDNFIKEKSKKLSQKFKPFQIKMKALKINENFSLKVLDQATIYLIYRDGSTNLKLNIGMILDHQEIVDTDTAEVGEVSNSLQRFPARTDSLAGLQKSVAHAQRMERAWVERTQRLRPTQPSASADQLVAGLSRPRPAPPGQGCCQCRKPPTFNLYYDTRLI